MLRCNFRHATSLQPTRQCCMPDGARRRWVAGAAMKPPSPSAGAAMKLSLPPTGAAIKSSSPATGAAMKPLPRRGAAMELHRVPISVALEVCRAARCCHGASPDVIGVALELCVHSAAMEQRRRLPVLRCGSHRRLLELRCSTRCCIGALAGDAGAARSPEQVPRRVMHHRCWVQTEALCGLMGVDRGGCKTKSRCHGCVAEGSVHVLQLSQIRRTR